MAEIKRVTLHPLKKDGSIDTDINLYPKTLVDGVVDREGNEVDIATQQELNETSQELNQSISAVRDLTNTKQDNLVSGENIKTINGQSVLGSGNVEIISGVWGNITGDISEQVDLQNEFNTKVSKTSQASKVYGTDSQGEQVVYNKEDFGKVDDVKVNNVSVVTNKIANIDLSSYATEAEIQAITNLIPAQATSENKLADKNFVNSSIATNTAYFKGTYNVVDDLHLTIDATHSQVATALASAISNPTNNDYAFVSYPDAIEPTQFTKFERYKYNSETTSWAFEFELNNSSFTANQWASINSGITAEMVTNMALKNANETITGSWTFNADVNANALIKLHGTSDYWSLETDDTYNQLRIAHGGTRKLTINDSAILPNSTNTIDLGNDYYTFKDTYIKGKHYIGYNTNDYTLSERNWNIYHNQYNELVIARTYNSQTQEKLKIDGGTLYSSDSNADIGKSENKYRDIYLSGQAYVDGINFTNGLLIKQGNANRYNFTTWSFNGYSEQTLGLNAYPWSHLYLSGSLRKNNANYGITLPDMTSWTANKEIATTDALPTVKRFI